MIRRAVSILLGLVAGAVLAEGATRMILADRSWTPHDALGGNLLEPTPYGHRIRPGLDVSYRPRWCRELRLRTDGRGFRCPAKSVVRPDTGPRVLVVGASYTWGLAVRAEEAWPLLMERRLAADGRPIRVTNASQPGHRVPRMVELLEELLEGPPFDYVLLALPNIGIKILGFVPLLPDGGAGIEHPYETVDGWMLKRDRPWRGGLGDLLRTRTAVGHRLVERVLFEPERLDIDPRWRPPFDRQMEYSRAMGRRLLEVSEAWRRRGARFAVISLPGRPMGEISANTPEDLKFFAAFVRAAGITSGRLTVADFAVRGPWKIDVDLRPGFDFNRRNRHYTVAGHRKVARRVTEWFESWR